jgi:hypothetical protein
MAALQESFREDPMRKKRGPYKVRRHPVTQPSDPSYRIIPLTRGQNTLIDTIDYHWLKQWNWFAHWDVTTHSFYAVRSKHKGKSIVQISMSREILQCEPTDQADHRNHDTLDNRRGNLRKATNAQNGRNQKIERNNTSGYIGVCWYKKYKKWMAQIGHQGIRINLGYFKTKQEAAHARDDVAKKLHGEFAVLNFPIT